MEREQNKYLTYKGFELEAVNINWTQHLDQAWQVNVERPSSTRVEIFYAPTAEAAFEKASKFIDLLD